MVSQAGFLHKIDLLLAANTLKGKVDPCNDQIWRFTSALGEPAALSLSTSYGLRAYSMRIFPRFHLRNEVVTNPDTFTKYPSVKFQTCEFVELEFKPFSSLDVNLKIWVPTSQVMVGQTTLTLTSEQPESLLMEWVAMLDPFSGGRHMDAKVHGVNTILTGKSQDIEPVFLLAGIPKTNSSAYSSLGLELALRPETPRKITWVLSSQDNEDLSFFNARRYSASSLDIEQEKLEMGRAQNGLLISKNEDGEFNNVFIGNSARLEQLILPPFGQFKNPSIVQTRNEDNGYSHSHDGTDSGPSWGIQNPIDVFIASRHLLPAHPEIIKGFVQNYLDQQYDSGFLDMNCSWNGKRSGLNITPLLMGLVLEFFNYTQDQEWLNHYFPQLVMNLKTWFANNNAEGSLSFPAWQHILQTGLLQNPAYDEDQSINLEILRRTANSPALASLLFRECKSLINLAGNQPNPEIAAWLEETAAKLFEQIQSSWNEQDGFFHYQDKLSHTLSNSKKVITYKRNGTFSNKAFKSFAGAAYIGLELSDHFHREIEIRINSAERSQNINEKSCNFYGNFGIAALNFPANEIETISIKGIKKDEIVSIGEPPLDYFDPSCVVPFWAGAANEHQIETFLTQKLLTIEDMILKKQFPTLYRIMLFEFLISAGKNEETAHLLGLSYGILENQKNNLTKTHLSASQSLHNLIPTKILLSLYGIEKWTSNEINLEINDVALPPFTVQYGKTTIEFLQGKRKIMHANGETVILDQPGKFKVMTA